jgi:hypothetical protein
VERAIHIQSAVAEVVTEASVVKKEGNMKRYRASIYIDIQAENEGEAQSVAEEVVSFLSDEMVEDKPEGYYNPYTGGVGEIISGDLIGNSKRLDHI